MNKKYIQLILKMRNGDLGRYISLCSKLNKPSYKGQRHVVSKDNFESFIFSKRRKSMDFCKELISNNLLEEKDKNLVLKFNILRELKIKIWVERFNLDLYDQTSMTSLGYLFKIIIYKELYNLDKIPKSVIKKIINCDTASLSKIINTRLICIKYNNDPVIENESRSMTIPLFYEKYNYENCIYRFLGEDNETLYVGKTHNLRNRMNQHYSKTSHLPSSLYEETKNIEYCSFGDFDGDMSLYEIYYINKFSPKYNKKDKSSNMTIVLPEITWEKYRNNNYLAN